MKHPCCWKKRVDGRVSDCYGCNWCMRKSGNRRAADWHRQSGGGIRARRMSPIANAPCLLFAVALTLFVGAHAEVLTPPYFNLAEGRKITATATCGDEIPELYCKLVGANAQNDININVIQGQVCQPPHRPITPNKTFSSSENKKTLVFLFSTVNPPIDDSDTIRSYPAPENAWKYFLTDPCWQTRKQL